MAAYGDRLIRLSDALAAMRKLAASSEFKDFGVGYSFLPDVGAALRAVEEAEAVPKDYHDRCMELEINLRQMRKGVPRSGTALGISQWGMKLRALYGVMMILAAR